MKEYTASNHAYRAHKGQKDKVGKPYHFHCNRVANYCRMWYGADEDILVVAWLHDVIEDTDYPIPTWQDSPDKEPNLILSEVQLDALSAISQNKDEIYKDYIRRCMRNEIARKVKLADLEDNLSGHRMRHLPDGPRQGLTKRYIWSREAIWAYEDMLEEERQKNGEITNESELAEADEGQAAAQLDA